MTKLPSRRISFAAAVVIALLVFSFLWPGVSFAVQAILTDDTYTDTGSSTSNFGTNAVVKVKASTLKSTNTQTGFIKFDLSTLPAGL